LKESIKRGDLDGMSFRFTVAPDGEEWSDDREQRTITRVSSLADICLATYPAYPAASVELRTRTPKENTVTREQHDRHYRGLQCHSN
jgi:HK97 family phage prohead protease